MKNIKTALVALALCTVANIPIVAAEKPTCVLMKFTDDTRFDLIESTATLSDLVMEKMVASGKFNLKETRPIDQNMEAMLYDEKKRELAGMQSAYNYGNFNELFEGPGFNETKAQSIATASVGQIVTPSITSSIGNAHGADYLIQGTIINLGTGDWWNDDFQKISTAVNTVSALTGTPVAAKAAGMLGPLGSVLGSISVKTTGVGVQSDLRIIKASTGEVIWNKRYTGIGSQKQIGLMYGIKIGSTKLNADLYAKGMDKVAQKMVDDLIVDMEQNKLFVK